MSGLEIAGMVVGTMSIIQDISEVCRHIYFGRDIEEDVKDIMRMNKDIEKVLKDVGENTRDSREVGHLGDLIYLLSRSHQFFKATSHQLNKQYHMRDYQLGISRKNLFSSRSLMRLAERLVNIAKGVLFNLNEILLGLAMPVATLWLNSCLRIWVPSATSERIVQEVTNHIPPSFAIFLLPPSHPSAFRPIALFLVLTLAFSFRMVGFAAMLNSKRRICLTLAAILCALYIGALSQMTPEEEFLIVLPAISSLAYVATVIHQYVVLKTVYNSCTHNTLNGHNQVVQSPKIPTREYQEDFIGIHSTDLSISSATEAHSGEKSTIQLNTM